MNGTLCCLIAHRTQKTGSPYFSAASLIVNIVFILFPFRLTGSLIYDRMSLKSIYHVFRRILAGLTPAHRLNAATLRRFFVHSCSASIFSTISSIRLNSALLNGFRSRRLKLPSDIPKRSATCHSLTSLRWINSLISYPCIPAPPFLYLSTIA